ncbi:MAG: 30S ribosomal protein S16 [Candidatus Omnitrophota bacterium]
MAAIIRLKRLGTKKKPHMRIVVCDTRNPRDGRFIEEIGYYDPSFKPVKLSMKKDRVQHWLKLGARPSPTVKNLIRKAGVFKEKEEA